MQLVIAKIEIVNVEITKECLTSLVAILSNGKVTNSSTIVKFSNTNLCPEGIISLSRIVKVFDRMMWQFSLHHNRIDNMESARCLSMSLKSHARINQLYLTCNIGSTPEILFVILQSNVDYINLNNNNIESLGAVKIAEYIESDPPIKKLSLCCNRLNDNDAVLILQALKRNTKLRELELNRNNFTSIGVKALLSSVFDSSNLNAIAESNHTLTGMNIFLGQAPGITSAFNLDIPYSHYLRGRIERLLWLDRTQKILLALQDKDSLLQNLANVPVELIPDVLAFPLHRVDDQCQHRYLNIVYSTMRWWNMPMLYSYHNCVNSKRKRND